MTFRLIPSCNFYRKDAVNGTYVDRRESASELSLMYESGIEMKVSGIIRPKEDATADMLQGSIAYTKALTDYVIEYTAESDIVKDQIANPDVDVITGLPFKTESYVEPDDETKVADFKEYIAGLNDMQKAELYKAIISTPTESEIKAQIETTIAMPREQLVAQIVAMYSAESGSSDSTMSADEIQAEIAALTDDELKELITAMLPDTLRKMQSATAAQQLAALTQEQLSYALAGLIQQTPPEKMVEYYDLHMPATVSDSTYKDNLRTLGSVSLDSPSTINIYAATFEAKDLIADEIANYNSKVTEDDQISYTDYMALLMSSVATIINVISYVLIAFVAISLVVSSIMIGIITYISVLERTKEIGILRAIGASKKDISRVFNAEALTIGFASGLFGILFTILFCIPVNAIIQGLSGISNIAAVLPPTAAVILVLISMLLTFIAGLLPSGIAAKKDPVEALRSE